MFKGLQPHREPDARHGLDILDRHRDAVEGTAHRAVRSRQRRLGQHRDVSVQRRIEAIDAAQERLGELPRREPPGVEVGAPTGMKQTASSAVPARRKSSEFTVL